MLFRKKANIILTFIILIIIAAIMIFIVTAFGIKIFEWIFPSSDKATLKSFDTLYASIDIKSKSMDNYDSNTMTLYLYDKYQVILFEANKKFVCDSIQYGRPSQCAVDKACICLYDGQPNLHDKEENVVKCYAFDTAFKVGAFEAANNSDSYCNKPGDVQFMGYIVAEQYDGKEHTIYVWINNEENRKKDKDMNMKTCPIVSGDVCSGKTDGTGVYGVALSEEINKQCKLINPKSTAVSGICRYGETTKKCTLECVEDKYCATINTCEGYTPIDGWSISSGFDYMKKGYMSEDYCLNDHCKIANKLCVMQDFSHYICKTGIQGQYSSTYGNSCNLYGCTIEMMGNPLNNYLRSYDVSCKSPNLNNFMKFERLYVNKGDFTKIFIKGSDGSTKTCDENIKNAAASCDFRTSGSYNSQFLLYYNDKSAACKSIVDDCYDQIYYCMDPDYGYAVTNPKIDPAFVAADPSKPGTKPCVKIVNPGTVGEEDYMCLIDKNIKFLVDIENTGKYSIKAKLISAPVPPLMPIIGIEKPVAKGAKLTLDATPKFNVPDNTEYIIELGAECTESICQNNPSLKSKILSDVNTDIYILFVSTLS